MLVSLIGVIYEVKFDIESASRLATLIFVAIVVLGTFALVNNNTFKKGLSATLSFLRVHAKWLTIGVGSLTVIWQWNLVYALSGRINWDPGMLLSLAESKHYPWLSSYFSSYPNNFFYTFFERTVWDLMGMLGYQTEHNFLIVLGELNYLILDLSALLLYWSLKKQFNQRVATWSLVLNWLLIITAPFGVLPYTDVPAYFLTTVQISLIVAAHLVKSNLRILLVVLYGMVGGLNYFIKPSTIIFTIALVIVSILHARKKLMRILTVLLMSGCIGFAGIYISGSYLQTHNHLVKIDKSRSYPLNHFIAIGLTDNGGWTAYDAEMNTKIKDPKQRKKFNDKLIVKRLQQRGFIGYLRFLAHKQMMTTQSVSWGWGEEGGANYLNRPFVKHPNFLQKIQRKIFMSYDHSYKAEAANYRWNGYKLIIQLVWLATIFAMLVGVKENDVKEFTIKMTILGSLMFLLIFEGGVSRYLIQFMPFVISLAAIGINRQLNRYDQGSIE